jgi:tRNA 2-thiouridine synthesizing protein A
MRYKIDITREHCPMTLVKVKLELEKIASGDQLEVLLNGGEPLENVPRAAVEQGYTLVEATELDNGVHRLVLGK